MMYFKIKKLEKLNNIKEDKYFDITLIIVLVLALFIEINKIFDLFI